MGAGAFYTVLLFSRFVEPIHTTLWFRGAFIAYVFVGLYLSVFYLWARYRATPSRVEKTRLLYLVIGGIATVTSALLEALPHGPNFGNAFIIVYMYFLSQNLVRYRLLDLNELLGRMQREHFWYRGRHRFLLDGVHRHVPQAAPPGGWSVVDLGGGCGGWLAYRAESVVAMCDRHHS